MPAATDLPGTVLWQTFVIWQRRRRDLLRELSVGATEFAILASLQSLENRGERTNQADVAALARVNKMTASQSVRSLLRKGMLARLQDPVDHRANRLTLTFSGHEVTTRGLADVTSFNEKFFAALGTDVSTFVALHRRLIAANKGEEPLEVQD